MATTPTSFSDVVPPGVMRQGGLSRNFGVPGGAPTWVNIYGQGQNPFKRMIAHPENFGGDMTAMLGGNGLPVSTYAMTNATGDPNWQQLMAGMTGGGMNPAPGTAGGLGFFGANGGTINPTMQNNYGNPGNVLSGLGAAGSKTGQGENVVPSNLSPEEQLLDRMFRGSATGQGGGPIANQLFNLGMGRLPPAMQEMITAQTNEQFGHLGSRFGTDLGTAISRGLGQAGAAQSMDAIHEILGLGGTTAGFQFQRGENALQRALQEWMTSQQTDLSSSVLQALLGGGMG